MSTKTCLNIISFLLFPFFGIAQTFSEPMELSSSLPNVLCSATGDFNNDGLVDIALCAGFDGFNGQGKVMWYPQLISGDFEHQKNIYISDQSINSIDTVDFDSDGFLDLLICSEQKIIWARNLGSDQWETTDMLEFSDQLNIFPFAISQDLNGDTTNDLIIRSESLLYYYPNNGLLEFEDSILIYDDSMEMEFSLEDLDQDGDYDLIGMNNNDQGIWLENTNEGQNFIEHFFYQYPDLNSISRIDVVDLDQNGFFDFCHQWGNKLYIIWNENNSVFSDPQEIVSLSNFENIRSHKLGDFNNDGLIDIIFGPAFNLDNTPNGIGMIKNNGNQEFSQSIDLLDTNLTFLTELETIELDSDENLDFVVIMPYFTPIIFKNQGNDNFEDTPVNEDNILTLYGSSPEGYDLDKFDIDQDGDMDIVIAAMQIIEW